MPKNPSEAWRKSAAEAQRKLWQDPEHRAKMVEARRRWQPEWDAHPERYSRRGVPNGWTKAEAQAAWAEAAEKADLALKGFQAAGILPPTDEQLASLTNEQFLQLLNEGLVNEDQLVNRVLRELFVIAMGPGETRTKLAAMGTILAFTKPKPARRSEISTSSPAEDWLRAAVAAGSATSAAQP